MDLEKQVKEIISKIEKSTDLKTLEIYKQESVGKSGFITLAFQQMKNLSSDEEKKSFGSIINNFRSLISTVLEDVKVKLEEKELLEKLNKDFVDISLPVKPLNEGSIHPTSRVVMECIQIFGAMGFEVASGSEIEDDFHNFTALNVPDLHPAKEMHDTFYVEGGNLLRTHTSSVQIRYMKEHKAPCKIIVPGRTYRCDYDMTHTPMFHQIEGLYIDKNINMGHLKYVLSEFLRKFFEVEDLPVRLRPSYFPFTEPSAEVDIGYEKTKDGIKVGKGESWLEILGCGMVHPNVLSACGIDPNEYQGFAFGMGLERIAMLKYGINDLRTFFEGDKRWLKHYNFPFFDIPTLSGGLS